MKECLTLRQVSELHGVTYQSIFLSMKKGKLKAHKEGLRWMVDVNDYRTFKELRYSRSLSRDPEGNLIYSPEEGRYSPVQIASILETPDQNIYYQIRTGRLKCKRIGGVIVIHKNDFQEFLDKYKPFSGRVQISGD